jgi:hypothetical protein
MKRKKIAVMLAAVAGALAMLVPATSHAQPTCLVIDGPNGLHIQVGYAPNGPTDCQYIPLG